MEDKNKYYTETITEELGIDYSNTPPKLMIILVESLIAVCLYILSLLYNF